MPHHHQRYATKLQLQQFIFEYQQRVINAHCPTCLKPCCNLTDVVLELDWKHLRALYRLTSGQKAFDRSLRDGSGPHYVRKQAGRYYTHGAPCPAFDAETHRCNQYHGKLKPENCSDFPLYLDGERMVADLRCEALNKQDLLDELRTVMPAQRFRIAPDGRFPILLYIDCP